MAIPAIVASVAGSLLSTIAQQALNSGEETTSTATTSSSQSLGKDEFLRLLAAQMRNQDPLNPLSNTDFLAQTAQFTSLEQLQNMNQTLQALLAKSGSASGPAAAAGLLGRTVTANGSQLQLDGQHGASLSYTLPSAAAGVALQVLDASGATVRTILLGEQGAGVQRYSFDGLSSQGERLPAGSYSYRVTALDAAGQRLSGAYTGAGQVTAIQVENGQLLLQLGGQRVPLAAVTGVLAGS